MKKIARLLFAALVLVGAVSTTSLADGGAPPSMCTHCAK